MLEENYNFDCTLTFQVWKTVILVSLDSYIHSLADSSQIEKGDGLVGRMTTWSMRIIT